MLSQPVANLRARRALNGAVGRILEQLEQRFMLSSSINRPLLVVPAAGASAPHAGYEQQWNAPQGIQRSELHASGMNKTHATLITRLTKGDAAQSLFKANYDWQVPPPMSGGGVNTYMGGIVPAAEADVSTVSAPSIEASDASALDSTTISASGRQALQQGLGLVQSLGPSIVGASAWSALLPLVNQSIASQLDVPGLINSLLQPAVNALSGAQSMTTDDIVTLLKQAAVSAGTGAIATVNQAAVTGGLDSINNQLLFEVPVTATKTVNVQLDAGQIVAAMGITLGAGATLSFTVSLNLDLSFGVNLNSGVPTDQQFFIRFNDLSASGSASASNVGANLNVGFLKASVVNGSASVSGQIHVLLNGADSSGNVNAAQLSSTPAAELFHVQTDGSASASLPIMASLTGLSVSGTPTITLQSSDPFSGKALSVATDASFASLLPFENASASDVLALLKSLTSDLDQIGKSADQGLASSLLSTQIPFTNGKTLRDLITLGQAFQNKVITPLTAAGGNPNFTDAQSLINALAQILGANTNAAYDPVNQRLTFQVSFAQNFTALTVPMSFDVNLGSLGGISSSSNVTITPGATLNMTIGIDLTPQADVLTGSTDLPGNGRLPADAHFSIDLGSATGVNGSDVPVLVTVPADSSNQSIDDLVADVNSALASAGLSELVVAGRSGNRLTFSTTYSSASAALSVLVPGGDAGAEALGLVNGSHGSAKPDSDRLYLQNATAKATVSVTTPQGINANAHYGFLGVGVANGSATVTAEADIALQDPATNSATGHLTLSEIAADLANPAALISSLSVSGSANASLPIAITPAIAGAALSGSPAVQVVIADLKNPSAAQLTLPQLGNLSSLSDMTFANALSALTQLASYLQSLAPLPEFSGKLPLINKSVDDLLGYSQKLLDVLNQIAASPDATLQGLSTDLNARLQSAGVHGASVALSFDNDAIEAKIHYQPWDYSGAQPFSLSLQDLSDLLPAGSAAKTILNGLGNIAEIGATGSVSAKLSADLELDLGIRLTTDPNDATRSPFTPFLYDSTHIDLTAQLDAANLNANVSLGPVGLFIVNGSAHLTKQTSPSLVESPAEIGITLAPAASHRYYFDQAEGAVKPVLQGQLSVDLPISTPTITNNIGDLTAFADLTDIPGTIAVSAPDLADAVKNFDLLSNLGVVVDGLDSLLGVVEDGLNDLAFIKSLPLIGNHLQDAFTFIDDLRSVLRNTLEPLVNNPAGDAVTEARKLIAQALGANLADMNHDGVKDFNDVPVDTSDTDGDGIVDRVEFELPIDETVQTSIPFDLGLPALNLSATGNLIVTAAFHLDLKFGVSAADGFFIDTDYAGGTHAVSANVSVQLPATLQGTLGFLHVTIQDLGVVDGNSADATTFSAGAYLDLKTPANLMGSDIPFTDLAGGTYDISDLASASISGNAAVNLRLAVDFGDEASFPHIQADLHVSWGFDGDPEDAASTPSVSFDNVRLDLGTFISQFLAPIAAKVKDVIDPILPVLNFLNSDVPVVSDIAGKNITWAEVLIGDGSLLSDLTGDGSAIDPTSVSLSGSSANFTFIRELISIVGLIGNTLDELPTDGKEVFLDLGSFSLAGTDLRDPANSVSTFSNFANSTVKNITDELASLKNDGQTDDASFADALGSSENLDNTGEGFDFPLFDDPTQAFRLLLGQDVTLVTFTPPQLSFNKNFSFSFSPFYPVKLTFGGDLQGRSNIQFGYDTHGLHKYLDSGDALDLLDGFYASSSGNDQNGNALPELSLHMDMYVGGGVDVDVASLLAIGQVNVDVDANLNDPNHDGKVHGDEILYELKNQQDLGDKILSILDLTGTIGWSLDIEASVLGISKSFTVASGTIASFDTNALLHATTLPDRFEPNDTQATAVDLGVAPGIHISGTSLHAAGDKDFYKFTMPRPGSVDVKINYESGYVPGEIEFDVLDAKGNIVARGRGSGDNVTASMANAKAGTYYVKVFGSGQSFAGSYSLSIDPSAGSDQHVYYVNDGSTANAYYTTAAGNDSNSGTDSSQPKASIAAILSSYILGPNDIIVVDSGVYSASVMMGAAQAGVAIYAAPGNQSQIQNTHVTLAGGRTLLYGFAISNTVVTFTDVGVSAGAATVENNSFSGTSQLIIHGSGDIENNSFSVSLAPAIDGDGAMGEKLVVLKNTFANSSSDIIITGSALLDIEYNTISNASFYGIDAAGGEGSTVANNILSLSSAAAGIRFSGSAANIENNSISGSGTYGIDVIAGDGDSILNNIVTGQATGIFSNNTGAISINNNTISQTTVAGINAALSVSADIKSNRLTTNSGAAIEVGGGTAHTVSQNNISGHGSTAIWLQNTGSGNVEYNIVASGFVTDIEIDGAGTSDASHNQLAGATTYGIYFSGGGVHSATENTGDVSSNASAIVRADGGVNAVEDNTFTGSAQRGVYYASTAYGQVDHNAFGTLTSTGIEVDGTGLVSITYNSFNGATSYGIDIPSSSAVTVENNNFTTSGSMSEGIRIDSASGAMVSGNQINGSGAVGIHFGSAAAGAITSNIIAGHSTSIQIDSTGSVDIETNTLSGSSLRAIDASSASLLKVFNNQITASSGIGIEYDAAGSADVESNHLANTSTYGIYLTNPSSANVVSNQLTNIVLEGIDIGGTAVPIVTNNSINGRGAHGILISSPSSGAVTGNAVAATSGNSFTVGIQITGSSAGTISANSVSGGQTGMEYDGMAAIDIESNTVSGSSVYGIFVKSASGATLKLNQILSTSAGTGIQASAASVASLFQNSVTGRGSNAIKLVADSVGPVTGNSVDGSFNEGIWLATTMTGAITGNSVSSSAYGIEFDGNAAVDFESNTINGSVVYALYAPAAIGGTILSNTINAASGTGVMIGGAGGVDIENNPAINGSTVNGIFLPNVTTAAIKNNSIAITAGMGIQLQSGSDSVISGNSISGAGSYGIYLTSPASGVIKSNTVAVFNSTGIRYDSSVVLADIESNVLSRSATYGIYVSNVGGVILGNSIAVNSGTGIEADGPGSIDIENNTGSGFSSYGIHVTHASSSTIGNNTNLGVSGAQAGIEVDAGATTISGNSLAGSSRYGIYLATVVTGPVEGNTVNVAGEYGIYFANSAPADIENNSIAGSSAVGIDIPSSITSTIYNNTIAGTGTSTGIRVDTGTAVISYNIIAGTGSYGVYLPTATTATVTDDEISGQTTGLYSDRGNAVVFGNKIHDNVTGVLSRGQVGGNDWSDPNLIYSNTTGVNLPVSTTLQFNRIYNNVTAVAASPYANINHNVIYRNSSYAIFASAANNISINSNTIYAPNGDAIRLVAASTSATIENNILWSLAGYDLYVSLDSVSGLNSDYNNLYATGSGKVAYDVIDFTDILDWMLDSGEDAHSIGTTRPNPTLDNPQFLSVAADDYHLANVTSTSIDAGDPATPYDLEPSPIGGRVNLGAYGDTPEASISSSSYLYLDSPRMYQDWVDTSYQYITWHSFNVTGNIDIEVDKEGVGKIADIAVVSVSTGQYLWSPQTSGLPADDSRYRIKITSVSNPLVSTASREAFAVPNQTHSFYINDDAAADDVYTTALGDNRNTGTSAADPKPSIAAVLRPYDLGAQDTIYVDTGHYIELQDLVISGIAGVGDDEGVTITGPIDPSKQAILDRAYPYNGAYALQLNNADFTTIRNLTLTGGEIGLWVENGSTSFAASNITVTGNTHDGLRIESDCYNPVLDAITATHNGRCGIYVNTTITQIEHSIISNNADTGLYLYNPGLVEVGANTISFNGTGIYVYEGNSGIAIIGDSDLSDTIVLGNQIFDNTADGIDASGGYTLVAGNSVYGQTGSGRWGINFSGGTVTDNDVFANSNGIISYGGTVTANRTYANSSTGIELYYGSTVIQNVVYSNAVGIYINNTSTLSNNLVYDNSSYGVQIQNASGTHLTNNTIFQVSSDAIHISGSANVDVRNNILWVLGGADLFVASNSQMGFTSDYNLLYATGLGAVGNWQGIARSSLAAWRSASFTDSNSLLQDPLFVSPNGADGQLGYVSAVSDGRDDDFHLNSLFGTFTGPGLAPVVGSNGVPVFLAVGSSIPVSTSPAIDRGDPTSDFSLEPGPNGGYVNLGAYGNTQQASLSPSSYVRVISPDGGEVWPQQQAFSIQWRTETTNSQSASDFYQIDLMQVGNSTPILNISAGTSNPGYFNWTVPSNLTPGSNYEIRVTRNGSTSDTSNLPFTIAAPIHLYYVNDVTVNAGDYTTASGDDANDGLTPATPKASIRAILAAYHLTANDVILVDAGIYTLDSNIVITSDDAGVTIRGFTSDGNPSESTMINRNNTASGSYGFELQGAGNITLDSLNIYGAQYGVYASNSSASENVTITNSSFHNNSSLNVYLPATNDNATLNNDTFVSTGVELDGNAAIFTNNLFRDASGSITIFSNGAKVTGNTVYNISNSNGAIFVQTYTAADIENNIIHDTYTALYTYPLTGQVLTVANNQIYNNVSGGNFNGNTLVTNNIVFGNTSTGLSGGNVIGNIVYDNATGIYTSGLIENNYVYDNNVGISSQYSGPVTGNHVYDNVTGIVAGAGSITGNLVYDNIQSIYLPSASSGMVINNTIIQIDGDAIVMVGHPDMTLRNNIFDVSGAEAHALNVSADSENGFNSDYNFYDLNDGALIATVAGVDYSSLTSWNFQLNLDRHSAVGDPQFVNNPAGADGILGSAMGLNGSYYATPDLSGPVVLQRVDSHINFTWNGSSPGGSVPGNFFSVRWTGYINVPTDGVYTFNLVADDGVRLYFDNSSTPAIDQWNYNNGATDTITLTLSAGLHPIELDYRQLGGGSKISFTWSGPSFNTSAVYDLSPLAGVMPGNYGLDDSFNVLPTSPTIDAGDPSFAYLIEPIPSGGRINLGYSGNTSAATTSAPQTVQVLSPNGLEKLTSYDPVSNPITVPISFRSSGLTTQDPVILIDSGSSSADGQWLADSYQASNTSNNSFTSTVDLSKITTALAPSTVYNTFTSTYHTNTLSYLFPVPYDADNSYQLTLEFVEPYYNPGQRVFNVVVNGVVVVPNYDIAAAAGGKNIAVELTLPVTAVAGQGIRVDLVQSNGSANTPILSALALSHVNADGIANPTVSLSYSTDGGSTYTPIASGISVDWTGSGVYNWQVPNLTSSNALIKITADNAAAVSDTSDKAFLISPVTQTYYVNDALQLGDVYTTAAGDDGNTGKSPDSPMATLSALLAAYAGVFKPGDVIKIDTGYYPLLSNITLSSALQGVTLLGPTGGGAVFDRGNSSSGNVVFTLSNADNLTIENLSITGAQAGIYASGNSDSDNVTIANCLIYGNSNNGIYFDTTNDNITLLNNILWNESNGISLNNDHNLTLVGNIAHDISSTAIFAEGQNIVGTNNTTYNAGSGMWFYNINPGANDFINATGNVAYGSSIGITFNGQGLASNNTAYNCTTGFSVSGTGFTNNTAYRNGTGILDEGSTVSANHVYLNTYGISTEFGGTILSNFIYNNTYGIATAANVTISNNTVYNNTQYGVWLQGNSGGTFTNNTVIQTSGDDVRLDNASGVKIENNILQTAAGYALDFTDAAESATHSDYNLFNVTGSASLINWGGTLFNTQADYYYATGQDQHSRVGDPGFVNPAGPDGLEGYVAAGLTGTYYGTTDLSGPVLLTRTDSSFYNINYSYSSPAADVPADNFSVRWSGYLYAPSAGTYSFSETSDDGLRLLINSTTVIDQWSYDSGHAHTGTITLSVGWNPIEIDYHDTTGSAGLSLFWSGPSFGMQPLYDNNLSPNPATLIGGDYSADDNFHLSSSSPAIDAGDPTSAYLDEPVTSGARIDQGAYGNTSQAYADPANTLQILSPSNLQKLQPGQIANVTWQLTGVGLQPVARINSGSNSSSGNYVSDIDLIADYGSSSTATTIDTSGASAPAAIYSDYDYARGGFGNEVAYQLPVPAGTYTLVLNFMDPDSSGVNQRTFNILLNGADVQPAFDIYAATGARAKAIDKSYTVTVTGNQGLHIELVNTGNNVALLNGLEIFRNTNVAVPTSTEIDLSTDNGATWHTLTTSATTDATGFGSFSWDPTGYLTNGNTALLRAVSGGLTAYSDGRFLIAPAGHSYYVNDSLTGGDVYATAPGNNANSGKTPGDPVASISVLLDNYTLTSADTIYVDTGIYDLNRTINIVASASGVHIVGPSSATPTANSYRDITNADAPLAYYRLGESAGTGVASDQNNVYNAYYSSGVSLAAAGALSGDSNSSAFFDGVSGQVTLPSGFSDFSQGLTFELWAYPTLVNNNQTFIELGNGASGDRIVFGRSGITNNLIFQVYSGNTLLGAVTASNAIALNSWQDFAVTMTPNGQNNGANVAIYKNGQIIATNSFQLPPVVLRSVNYLAQSSGTSDRTYAGLLDEVAIYSHPLSDVHLLAHYMAASKPMALIDRGSTNYDVIDISSATGVDLEHLTITDAHNGIVATNHSNNLQIIGNTIFGNYQDGIYVDSTSSSAVISSNDIFGLKYDGNLRQTYDIELNGPSAAVSSNLIHDAYNQGVSISAAAPTVVSNTFYNNPTAGYLYAIQNGGNAYITNNIVRNNSTGLITYYTTLASGNIAYSNSGTGLTFNNSTASFNTAYANNVGIYGSGSTLTSNIAYSNSTGMGADNSILNANKLYSNSIGLDLGASSNQLVTDNLVYANSEYGIYLHGGSSDRILNNTIDQAVGDALRLESISSLIAHNNIILVQSGRAIYSSSIGSGVDTDYNDLYIDGSDPNAAIGFYNGSAYTSLAAWQTATGRDAHSLSANPKFVDPDGADNVLGVATNGSMYNGGADDNFSLSAGSPLIDRGDTLYAAPTDALSTPRLDDPATTNAGSNDYYPTDAGSSQFTIVGTAQNWRGNSGAYWTISLPFSFTFYGTAYNSVYVAPDGFIQFGTNGGMSDITTDNLYPRIAVAMDNLTTAGTGDDIFVSSTSSQWTIRWVATRAADNSPVNISVDLFPDGRIQMNYGSGNTTGTPIVGLFSGNSLSSRLSPNSGIFPLTNTDSILFTSAPGYVDIGAFEFRGSSADTHGPAVTATTPTTINSSTFAIKPINTLSLTFSEPLNPIDALASANYDLRSPGPDGQYDTPDDILISFTPSYDGAETVTLIPSEPLDTGPYRLTLEGSATSALHDLAGNALDGDGNGAAGGDYVRTFYVKPPNTVPTLNPISNSTVTQTTLFSTAGSFTDPDLSAYDTWTGAVNFGDGTGNQPLSLSPDHTFNLSHIFQTSGTFNVSLSITDSAGIPVTEDFHVTVNPIPPVAVTIFQVNDGSAQRSMVTSLTIVFDRPYTPDASAFTLTRHGGGATVSVLYSNPSGDGKIWVLTFTGANITAGSLADGTWVLTIHSPHLADPSDGLAGSGPDLSFTFFRLYGDTDGDGDVDTLDYLHMRQALNATSTSPNYAWYLDYDQNSVIDINDANQFKLRLGTSVTP